MHPSQYKNMVGLGDRLLTVSEARVVLHCSRSTIYKLFKLKRLMPVKLGTGTRVRSSDLTAFMMSLPSPANAGAE